MESMKQVNPATAQAENTQELITEYLNFKRIEEEAKKEKELLGAKIKAALPGYGQHFFGQYKVTYSSVTQSRVDSDALKAKYPAVYAAVCKTSTSDRLTVN